VKKGGGIVELVW